MFTVKTSNYNA